MDILYYTIPLGLSYVFYQMGGTEVIQNTAVTKFEKFRTLTNTVSKTTRQKNTWVVLWISLVILLKALYICLCQWFNKTVVQLDKKTYEVRYVISGRPYIMQVTPRRGPKRSVLQVLDNEDEDVTDTIQMYLGPHENFHGVKYKPSFFQKEKLFFELGDGRKLEFSENEEIDLEDGLKEAHAS